MRDVSDQTCKQNNHSFIDFRAVTIKAKRHSTIEQLKIIKNISDTVQQIKD